jgi:hypothetical protein
VQQAVVARQQALMPLATTLSTQFEFTQVL